MQANSSSANDDISADATVAGSQEAGLSEAASSPVPPPPPALVLTRSVGDDVGFWALAGDTLWDGCLGDEALHGLCVVVHNDRIVQVCPVREAIQRGVPIERYDGCCVMPGLIDAHVHMEFTERHPLHEQPVLTAEQLHEAMVERATRMAYHGITTARDLGGGSGFHSLTLRDEILAGRVLGPRLLCAGQPLTTPNGHCHQWGGSVSSAGEILDVVHRQASRKVDWIKVMATGGIRTPGTRPDEAQFSEAELRDIVAAASAYGLPVAAHAHATVGITAAVAAGCRTVEHCSWIGARGWCTGVDDATIAEMVRLGVFVAPTANANWGKWDRESDFYKRTSAALRRLHFAGVQLVASSDAGAIPGLSHDNLAGAISVLGDMAGLSNADALRSATSTAADALGVGHECGRLRPGLAADLLVVSGPAGGALTDLHRLRRPRLVVLRGRRVNPRDRTSTATL